MHTILLSLARGRVSEDVLDTAVVLAREKSCELVALFVLDPEAPAHIAEQVGDTGFLGERTSEELASNIDREHRLYAERHLQLVRTRTQAEGIGCRCILREGNFAEETLKASLEFGVQTIVVSRTRRSEFARTILGSEVKKIRDQARCDVVICEPA